MANDIDKKMAEELFSNGLLDQEQYDAIMNGSAEETHSDEAVADEILVEDDNEGDENTAEAADENKPVPVKRGRGRPPKAKIPNDDGEHEPKKRAGRTSRIGVSGSLTEYVSQAAGNQVGQIVSSMPKKVAEKAANLIAHFKTNGQTRLSCFTQIGFDQMSAQGGLSNQTLVDRYTHGPGPTLYSLGTARSQAQQVTTLFVSLGIGVKQPNDKTILPNEENEYYQRYLQERQARAA